MQLYVLPHLPLALYALAYPKRQTPWLSGAIPDLIASGSASGSSSGGTPATSHSDASTVSGLTTPTPTKPPPSGRGAYMANLTPVTSLTALDRTTVKIKDLIGTTTPPKMAMALKCAYLFTFAVAAGPIVAAPPTIQTSLPHRTSRSYINM
jgi:hypothetical protein